NVGKSLLFNTILGQKRAIVNQAPGTTRDAVDTLFHLDGQPLLFIDTAGIRRRGRREDDLERHSVGRALEAIHRADVALLVTDASEGITAQDSHIAGYVHQDLKGLVIVINKWDLIPHQDKAYFRQQARERLKFLSYAPICFTSAKLGQGIPELLSSAQAIAQERAKRLPTPQVNALIETALADHNPPSRKGQRLKIFYATQAGVTPPTFVFFANDARLIHFSYQRYLENKIREAFGFTGTPLRLIFKSRGEGQR
ncbi:MAG: ribosome biogenesis GTPase Der, partial [Chloroflexi bacterium]|nr:ribosome biogenesis GTPase Der [Chloroflexota bacterium]